MIAQIPDANGLIARLSDLIGDSRAVGMQWARSDSPSMTPSTQLSRPTTAPLSREKSASLRAQPDLSI